MDLLISWLEGPSWWFVVIVLLLDQLFGDPHYAYHPVRQIGKAIQTIERFLRKWKQDGYVGGIFLVLLLSVFSLFLTIFLHFLLEQIHPILGELWFFYLGYSLIALKDLSDHAKRVAHAVEHSSLADTKRHVSMMVGRDTENMDQSACIRATIESISESLIDGVISPLLYLFVFGVPGLVFYKVVNTLDSMVGYRNERYAKFGYFSAKLDDWLNWIPARLTWCSIVLVSLFHPHYCAKKAYRIGLSQHGRMSSPNSGWSEATFAGALEIQLVGPVWRKGKKDTEFWLGSAEDSQQPTTTDLVRSIHLSYWVTLFFVIVFSVWQLLF